MAWDESKVKRVSKGRREGGQFTTKEGIERAATAAREAAGLPPDSDMLKALNAAGFSVDLQGRTPKSGYMSARTLETEWKAPIEEITELDIARYINAHRKELLEKDAYAGGWNDKGWGYLDVSYNYQDLHEALTVARKGQQQSVYDVVHDSYIDVEEYWRKYDGKQ